MQARPAQALIFGGALLLWAACPLPILAAPVLAYLCAWLTLELALRLRLTPPARASWLLVAAVPLAALRVGPVLPQLADNEQLPGLLHVLRDRARLQETPAIAPPLVSADQPQRFFLFAPGAREAGVRFGPNAPRLSGRDLGHGVFRIDYDPRRHGPPDPPSGALDAALEVDGREVTRRLEATRATPHPRRLTTSPGGALAASVSEETDELLLLDAAGRLTRIPTADGPVDAAFLPDGGLVVAHRHDGALWSFAPGAAQPSVTARLTPGLVRLAVSPSGAHLLVARDAPRPALEVLSLPDLEHRGTLPLDTTPLELAFGPTDEVLVVAGLADARLHRLELDLRALRRASHLPPLDLGRPATTLARRSDGARLELATSDRLRAGEAGGNHQLEDQLVGVDVTSWRIVERFATASTSEGEVRGASPSGIAFSASGARLVVFAGSDELWRLDPGARGPSLSVGALGRSPPHLTRVGSVTALAEGRVAVASAPLGILALLEPDGAPVAVHALGPERASLEPRAHLAQLGELAFWETTRSGASCQTCHLHADSDRGLHDIGHAAPRPTLGLRGIAKTAPYLRGASYPTLASLEVFAQTILGGYLTELPERAAALAAFVERLPPGRPPSDASDAALRAGMEVFVKARCVTCHRPPAFTDLAQYPERLLFPRHGQRGVLVDTPSLLDVASRGPYLYDGRASTLVAVLEDFAEDHGAVHLLEARERATLLAFLEAL